MQEMEGLIAHVSEWTRGSENQGLERRHNIGCRPNAEQRHGLLDSWGQTLTADADSWTETSV
jgi:hypothetical protein